MKRESYTTAFKLKVIQAAEETSNRAASRQFSIAESNIRLWRKSKTQLEKMPKSKRANRAHKLLYPEVDEKMLEWVAGYRAQGLAVSTVAIRLKAKMVAKEFNYPEFKASSRWCHKFMARHNLSVRKRTHIAQKLPEDVEGKVLDFQKYIITTRKQLRPPLCMIGNADQTPLTFDLPSDFTVNEKGASTISIKTTGHEKNRFTVMLACMSDGTKLPPYVIFKRKTLPKGIPFPSDIIVRAQTKGWMDRALMKDWVNVVWSRRPGGLLKIDHSLLVLDAFRCHRNPEFLNYIKNHHKTEVAIIPGGMTSILQPLDVGVNRPFKAMLRGKWQEWMHSGKKTLTPSGRIRAPDLQLMCQWISEAWRELDKACIIKTFKHCCISNAMDGSEDDILWEESTDSHNIVSADDYLERDDHSEHSDDDLYYADDVPDDVKRLLETSEVEEDFFGLK